MTVYTRCGKVRATGYARHSIQRFTRYQIAVFYFVFFGMSLAAANAEPTKTMFNIEHGPAKWSLTVYAQQAEVPLGFSVDIVGDILTNPVKGEYDNEQALELLLEGTGLEVEHGERGIIIRQTQVRESGSGIEEPTPITAKTNSFRLTQIVAQAAAQSPTNSAVSDNLEELESPPVPIEEIVVTGSQIRGTPPVGVAVVTLDREYIELSGLATTQEILQSVPQNFGDGAGEANSAVGFGAGVGNFGLSSSVNLRGLGSDSTLVLLNGRRSASGGGQGGFVDLNSIPSSAIERIEILPDGASAIYGSDAVGGVINVILRNDYEGAETRVRYAPDLNDIDETQFNQVFGKNWNSGNVLFTYEYYDRSSLRAEDRDYTSNSDLTSLGGTDHRVLGSNPGNITRYTPAAGGRIDTQLAIPSDQDGTALTRTDLLPGVSNLQNQREGSTVLPEQTRNSVFVAVSQELSESIDLFAEARYSTRKFESLLFAPSSNDITVPNTNPFFVDLDPLGGSQNLRINYSYVDDYGAARRAGDVDTTSGTLGATFSLSDSWELEVYGSYNTEDTYSRNDRRVNTALLATALADPDPNTAFNPFGDGSNTNPATLAAIEGFRQNDIESGLAILNVLADGDLFQIPGGAAKVAIGAQFRDESLLFVETEFTSTPMPVSDAANFDLDRDVISAFLEVYLPIVTSQNNRPGVRELVLSIAGRYEDYSDFGDTFDPKLGVSWSPVESLALRATTGMSFRAPLLAELNPLPFILFFTLPDPDPAALPSGTSDSLVLLGQDGQLTPQEGTTWTVGFDITPASLQRFRLSLTYFDTEVDDLIQAPSANFFSILTNPVQFASSITRCPCDPATLTTILNGPGFTGTPPAPDEVEVIVNDRLQNVAKAELSGLDLELNYAFDTDTGDFDLSLYASRLFDFKNQLGNGASVDVLDTITNPTSLKLRSSLSWQSGGISAAIFGNHVGDYTDNTTGTNRKVSSWTTWDLRLGYDFDAESSGLLDSTKVSLNIQNVLDEDPPFADGLNGVGFDSINASPFGRFAALQITKTW